MSDSPVVFGRVWKKFRRGQRHDSLRDVIPSFVKRAWQRPRAQDLTDAEFWALRDVSFDVNPGEALGIIGPNGAGKSTALKLLTKILKPTQGRCEVTGRVGALIEVAAGFHPDLTGRENIYLQGAIMGMSQAEIARKFDQIVEFAGVGEFVGTQVKRYSSGMNARLGFAIAAHLDPDVLLIDEVLSVGDAGFQAQCVTRMRELIAQGIPLVFVSHNLPAILQLCTRAIFIDRGKLVYDGDPQTAVQEYRRAVMGPTEVHRSRYNPDSDIWIRSVQVLDDAAQPAELLRSGGSMTIRIGYEAARPVERPDFAVDIHRGDGVYCYGINSLIDRHELGTLEGEGYVDLVIPHLWLLPGCYLLSVGIHVANGQGLHDLHQLAYPFTVASDHHDLGLVYLEHAWRHDSGRASTSDRNADETVGGAPGDHAWEQEAVV